MPEPGRLVLIPTGADGVEAAGPAARLPYGVHLRVAALQRLVLGEGAAGLQPAQVADAGWESALLVAGVYVAAGLDVAVSGPLEPDDVVALLNRAHELADRVEVVGPDGGVD